ncbi:MAG: RNA polymerase sigma factor [Bacteroidetes bacterium]|jgi:RNA polymerase sigma-70 factor (ECF subfamily)|nr:RNA polymerase sigma factor [Bacteroidota bacterium]MBT3422835.1 RNA polymerase sigma factor [Bacteroidota bacterium]MBT3802185.1 RNA polymerase sigma factor [Bacteroidota bacterium]MBT3935539.1 RNA polymerase sigma factor [Bacteroidota bacterium]MBT4339781.1 RNA polymerase sigma factor [Bacteroidota bacterium]
MNEKKLNNEDKKLIEACLKGDSLAQKRLFKKYYNLMFAICLRYTNDQDNAKEILQEGYIKVFNNIAKFKFEGNLSSWIKRIMINTAIDRYRKTVSEPDKIDLENNENISTKADVYASLEKEDLLKCVQKLPNGYRTIFNMYVIEGYSHKDIARELGINEGTSKSQLFKAKQMLQGMVNELFK